jgi:hypothetical protein
MVEARRGRTRMRPLVVKRQTPLKSGFLPFFSAVVEAERRSSLATCSVFISVGWRTDAAAPHTDGGALATVTTSAETTPRGRCDRETSRSPRAVLYKEAAERYAFARSAQARGRGGTRPPDTSFALWSRAGAEVQAQGRAQGQRPMCAAAFATQGYRHDSARAPGSSRDRPVRHRAPPLRS